MTVSQEILANYPGIAIRYCPRSQHIQAFFGASLKRILNLKRKPQTLEMDTLRNLIDEADKSTVLQKINQAIDSNQGWNIEYRIVSNNQTLWLREQGYPGGSKRNPIFDIFIQDVTEFKKLSRQLNRKLERANEQAGFKNEFFASISHEIRTPMNAVLGVAQVLSKTILDAEQKQYVSTIIDSSHSLVQIINDILDFSKLEAGKIEIVNKEFDLEKLCLDVCQLLTPHAEEKQLSLYLEFNAVEQRKVIGDKTRIRQVLVNLIGNAIKFTPNGHVRLNVSCEENDSGNENFIFNIEDSGIGISQEAQARLFQAYSQADASISQNYGGTGLGLRICQQLVNLMGGDIGVKSECDQGTTFWFTLPLQSYDKTSLSTQTLESKKVIVVENDPVLLNMILSQLLSWGMDAYPIADSEDTLALLAMPETYDLFVINKDLQGLDGLKLTSLIKRDARYQSVPVLLLTSITKKENSASLQEAGVTAYTSMPLSPGLLHHALNCALDKSRDEICYVSSDVLIGDVASGQKSLHISGRVLIVDDIDVNRLILNSILSRLGLVTEFAENGKVALEKVRAQEFDMVFMDCRMPVMDGYEASREIRKLSQPGSEVPIVALTANAGEDERQACLAAGMNGYLAKPYVENDLLKILSQWMPESKITEVVPEKTIEKESGDIDVIDTNQWDSMRGVMDDEFDKFVLDGLSKFERYNSEIVEAFGKGDLSVLKEKAHALKGMSALLGASLVSETAAKIERASEEKEFEIININLAKLKEAIQETSRVMTQRINPDMDQSIILF